MKFRYTKFGFYDALLSLIPIFPVWSLFFGVGIAQLIRSMNVDCEIAYEISKWICLLLVIVPFLLFILKFKYFEIKRSEKEQKKYFKIFNLIIYTFLNNFIFSAMMGDQIECYGSSLQVLDVIYSGPLTSLFIIAIGLIFDILRHYSPTL
jgi:quinol-cytochrome oxidoreductase complex cytochrome b subunit